MSTTHQISNLDRGAQNASRCTLEHGDQITLSSDPLPGGRQVVDRDSYERPVGFNQNCNAIVVNTPDPEASRVWKFRPYPI